MKITICGSITFIDQMIDLQQELTTLGHEAKAPEIDQADRDGKKISSKAFHTLVKSRESKDDWVWQSIQNAMHTHFRKIEWSNAILVANYEKNNIPGYIGGNTLIELGIAVYLKKRIFLLNPIPEMPYHEEIRATQPTVLSSINTIPQ